jgi:F0F1-type ATP synthase assembly protein I
MQPANSAKYATLGITYAATIGVFTVAGWWLDAQLGTEPWLLILFVFAGFAGGMFSLIRKVPPPTGGRDPEPPSA